MPVCELCHYWTCAGSADLWICPSCLAELEPTILYFSERRTTMKTKTRRFDDSATDELRERIQEALEEADEAPLKEVAECLGLEHMDEDEDEDDKDKGKTRDLAAGGMSTYAERRARRKWAESTFSKFSEDLKPMGTTRATFVEAALGASDKEFEESQRQFAGLTPKKRRA